MGERLEMVRQAVAEVLGVAEVGGSDNFVELGGNSLLAVVLANRLEEELGVRPDILDIFAMTVAELAARLEKCT